MSHVFLAYKRPDFDHVVTVCHKLVALGVDVFIDQQMAAGQDYLSAINKELNSARAVLVFWSKASVAAEESGEQNFLMSEVHHGWHRGILIAASLDKVAPDTIPVPYNRLQAPDLTDWIEKGCLAKHPSWQRVLEGLAAKIGRPGLPALALVLEDNGEQAKRKFLRDYPNDLFANRIAAEIVNEEKAAFEQAMATAKSSIDRRRRDGEKTLKECRQQFEIQIAQLSKGGEFFPPDPVNALDDNVAMLKDQIEIYESKIEELQILGEQSKSSATEADERIGELTRQVELLTQQQADAEAAIAEAARAKSELESLQRVAAKKDTELARRDKEIASFKQTAAQVQQDNDMQRRDIKKLQTENVSLKRQIPGSPWPRWASPWALAAAGVLAGLFLGGATAYVGGYMGGNNTQIASSTAELNRRVAELDRRAAEQRAAESRVNEKNADLSVATSAADKRASELKTQAERLAGDQRALGIKENAFNERDRSVSTREQDVKQRELAATAKEKELLQKAVQLNLRLPNQPEGPANSVTASLSPSAECDNLSGAQYDRDRPKNNGWVEILPASSLAKALTVCQTALAASQSTANSTVDQRRQRLEIGRILAAQSLQEAQKGNAPGAQKLFDSALDSLRQSAKLGSGQAYYFLGYYYREGFVGKDAQTRDVVLLPKDPQIAWDNFMQSANLGDPVGLTTVAFSLLLPNWTDKLVKEDIVTGRKYLDSALKTEFPRAYFVFGLAKIEGKGFDQNRTEGLQQIEIAYCKNDPAALRYVKAHRIKITSCT